MSSIDREKELIKSWAAKSSYKKEGYCNNKDSFWEEYDSNSDIQEYDFVTMPELKKSLEEIVGYKDEVILAVCAAALKNKYKVESISQIKAKDIDKQDDFSVPEFIYVF